MSKKEVITWEPAFFIALEWERYDNNGNSIYTAYFLLYGTVFHKFCLWDCSEAYHLLYAMKPLTQCKLQLHWKRNKKWLLNVETLAQ